MNITTSCILFALLGCTWVSGAAVLPQAVQNEALGNEGQWQVWKLVHEKKYGDIDEDQHRKAIWQANLKVCPNAPNL